jgi:hypothetical protein
MLLQEGVADESSTADCGSTVMVRDCWLSVATGSPALLTAMIRPYDQVKDYSLFYFVLVLASTKEPV